MNNELALVEEREKRLAKAEIDLTRSRLSSLESIKADITHVKELVSAIVTSSGGEVRVFDRDMARANDVTIESFRDEKDRCLVLRAVREIELDVKPESA